MCEKFRVLPKAGGLEDQDSLYIHYALAIMEYDQIRAEIDQAQTKSEAEAAARR